MLGRILVGLGVLAVVGTGSAAGQSGPRPGWQLAAGVGPYRIDDLAGTPVIPAVSVTRAGPLTLGATLWGIRGAGFYSLDALALDLAVGPGFGNDRVEGSLTVGPSGLLGGDSDGTPYISGGGHLTASGTVWVSGGIGVTAAGSARGLLTSGTIRFTPSLMAGLRIRL